MNLYDMLRLMTDRGPYTEPEKIDMNAVITEAENMNTLGGLAKTDVPGHVHIYDQRSHRCLYCPRRIEDNERR